MKAVSLAAALVAAGFAWWGVWEGAIVFGLLAVLAAIQQPRPS